ncbi:hypothetical protein [Iamia sp.]|uniref:hypothetical protein n=1 Tax=Iamia sp. TaxID=2722710 RepID=UPI002CDB718C|nr:hypothetical protein [Iamia sp.]HXH58436.1 hypothetical protein [Iamia sp.]
MSDTLTEAPADPHAFGLDLISDLAAGLIGVADLLREHPELVPVNGRSIDGGSLVFGAYVPRSSPDVMRGVAVALGDDAVCTVNTYSSGSRYLRVRRSFGAVAYEAWTPLDNDTVTATTVTVTVADLDNLLPAGPVTA